MCKLYALQAHLTQAEARRIIAEKIKIIRRTEDDGLGVALNCGGKTLTWQCGEAIFDAAGDDVCSLLDDKPKLATITIHGRTSTSRNTTVEHSHPRATTFGPLMHNGVVRVKNEKDWKVKYDLDTDYLANLASNGMEDQAHEYLDGYAAILLLKEDGTLIIQNQGASLHLLVKENRTEVGTTTELCHGQKFENMRAEVFENSVWVKPIPEMGRSSSIKQNFQHITNKGVSTTEAPKEEEKKQTTPGETQEKAGTQAKLVSLFPMTPMTTSQQSPSANGTSACEKSPAETQEIPRMGRTVAEMGPQKNKKGRFQISHPIRPASSTSSSRGEYISVHGKLIHISDIPDRMRMVGTDHHEILSALRSHQREHIGA